ncbi:MAG TPA: hypothetical protein VF717_09465 [Pyrinomonadaceae bacterium]|jgi:hypothetical protein
MNTITISYECVRCHYKGELPVPARPRCVKYATWEKQIMRSVGAHHLLHSPGCSSKTMSLNIPVPEGKHVGGA